MNSLVLYYSRTGNTRMMAETIAGVLGSDIEALQDNVSYQGLLGFLRGGRDAWREIARPIRTLAHHPQRYDLIIVGQPVWASLPVPAIRGLLRSYDLAGRKVGVFVTSEGSGDQQCLERLTALLPAGVICSQISFLKVRQNQAENIAKARQWAESLKTECR